MIESIFNPHQTIYTFVHHPMGLICCYGVEFEVNPLVGAVLKLYDHEGTYMTSIRDFRLKHHEEHRDRRTYILENAITQCERCNQLETICEELADSVETLEQEIEDGKSWRER